MKSEKLPSVATGGNDLIYINNSKLPHWVKYSAVAIYNSSNGKIADGVAKISTATVESCDKNSVTATSTTTATVLPGSDEDEEDEL